MQDLPGQSHRDTCSPILAPSILVHRPPQILHPNANPSLHTPKSTYTRSGEDPASQSGPSSSHPGMWMGVEGRLGMLHSGMANPYSEQERLHQGMLLSKMETLHSMGTPALTKRSISTTCLTLSSCPQNIRPTPQLHTDAPGSNQCLSPSLPLWTAPQYLHTPSPSASVS